MPGKYGYWEGTSMAAPFVSGTAAWLEAYATIRAPLSIQSSSRFETLLEACRHNDSSGAASFPLSSLPPQGVVPCEREKSALPLLVEQAFPLLAFGQGRVANAVVVAERTEL